MIREIVKDPVFLQQKSLPATEADLSTGLDLLDTLSAHRETCVGLAANMIGVSRRIIVFDDGGKPCLMFNPEIVQCSGPYEAEEGCLSLTGTARPGVSAKSRFAIRTSISAFASARWKAGRLRSPSTRSTIAAAF